MRAQAAANADLILLVVAADEGLLDQTFECLNIITDFKMPVVVVISKCKKPGARVEDVRRELQRLGARLLDAGTPTASVKGEMVAVEVSVREGHGLDVLRRALFGVSALLPLEADANAVCVGSVVEAFREDKGRGDVARCVVKEGTLRVGDWVVSDVYGGRVKAMRNSRKESLKECGPGGICELMGMDGLPAPGAELTVCSQAGCEAITQERRLELQYPTQQRFQPRPQQQSAAAKEAEDEEADEEEEDEPTKQTVARPAAGARRQGPVPSFFSSPRPFGRPSVPSPAPAAAAAAAVPEAVVIPAQLQAAQDVEPLPVIIKASSVGQLQMVSSSATTVLAHAATCCRRL